MIGQFPRRLLTAGEQVIEEFHPHWRIMVPAMASAALASVLSVAALVAEPPGWVPHLLALLWVGTAVLAASGWVRRISTVYVLTDQRLVWRWGVLRRAGIEFPLEQINTVSFSQSIFERALGFGDLEIESASANGTSRFDNIPDPQGFQSKVYSARNALSSHQRTHTRDHSTPEPLWEALERLSGLYERGLLDGDEFATAKRELLGRTGGEGGDAST